MLQEYGTQRFLNLLRKLGFTSFNNSPDHYGLSLILGGGEASLFELVNAYTGMAATLLSYNNNYAEYPSNAYGQLKIEVSKDKKFDSENQYSSKPLSASSIWLTYEALKQVIRPESETGWENFRSSAKVAWKTGTSHGYKDAWAIGTTADYVVGVWAGNANGEGRSGLTGTKVAAPIMFDVFSSLRFNNQFYPAYDELVEVEICTSSGNLASPICPEKEKVYVTEKGAGAKVCSYHKMIFTDKKMEYRMSQKCTSVSNLQPVSWFVLPPIQEFYYSKKHPGYRKLPPFAKGCGSDQNSHEIDLIYPVQNSSIYVPTDETLNKREIVFEISHHNEFATVYWHLDNQLIGITSNNHQLPFIPEIGVHKLTVVDENGESVSVVFEVVH